MEVVAEGLYPLNFTLDPVCARLAATVWIIFTRILNVILAS